MADEMTFGYEEDSNGGFDLIAPDTYELICDKAEPKTASNGREYLSFQWTIRGDIPDGNANQKKYAGRKVFDSVFKARDGSYGFDARNKRLSAIVATQLNKGDKGKTFSSLQDILNFITGGYAQGIVAIYSKTTNNADITLADSSKYSDARNEIRWYRHTKHGTKTLGGATQSGTPNHVEAADVSDDDLPF